MAFQIEFQGSLTKDEIICDQRGGDSWISQEGFIGGDFLTINPKECTVRWFSEGGQAVVRLFQFSQAPLDAIFCLLNENMTVPDPSFSFDFKENRRLCVAVLTTSHELHLYYQTGDKYEIMLPATSKYLLATSAGLLIQATMFNVQENFLPIELDQPDDDFDPNQLLFPTTEIQETNMILYLNSPNSTVDVIPSSLSEAYANYQLSSSYYNWISLYHVKGNAFVIASLDPVTKNEKSKEEFNVLDHTLSPSSLLQRSLNSESGEFKEFDKSGFLVNQSHVSSHSKGSKRMSITPGSGQRVRPPSRSSPSPTVFTKALTGITQFPTASPTHNQTRVSPSGIMETSVGSGVNQYSGETLHNLLGLKRQTSRDQDRNLTGINMPNAAANQSRLSGGLSGSLEKSHSVEDIDFTMNTLIDGIYNDILPLSEANIVFSLKALESIPEFIGNEGKSPAESGTGDSKLTITFIGNLKEQLLLLIHIQRIKVLKIYQIRSIDNLVSNLSPSWTTSSPIELVHKQDLSSLDDSSFSVCSYSFYSSAVLQSSSAIWKVPIILQNSVSGFSINVVGTRTSFSFPSGNVKDQESWISQLLSLDESEEADQISFGQHLGGVVQSLNYQFSNFILDHQKKKKIGRLSFITPSSVEDHQAQAMIIIFQLFKQVFVGFENFLSVVSALWIRLSFMTNFQQRNEFFLVIFFLLLNSDQSSTSLSDQVQILLNTCYDDGAREDLSNLIQEMLVHLPTGEVALNLTKKALFSILLVQFEMSLLDNSSLNSVSPRFTLKVSTYIHQLLSQIKHFMLVTYRSWSNTASVKFFESFYQIIENNANHDILDVLFQKSLPFQKDFLELIDQMKLSSFSSLFVVFTFLNKLRANETALGHKESASVRVVVAFIEAVQLLFNSGVGIPEKLSIISERQWNDVLHRLPAYLQYLLILSFELSRYDASPSWPIAVLKWMNRNDLCANLNKQVPAYLTRRTSDHSSAPSSQQKTSSTSSTILQVEEISDGLLEVENESILRFPEDDRMHEVCRLLRSSLPCYLNLERSPEQSEPEFRQKQQMRLLTLCRRTLSCPVGRGMLTIGTTEPLMAEALAIPPLSLNGRVPPTNSIVSLDLSTAHVDLKLWPEFHNGVAAALRVGPAEILQRVNSNSSSTSSSNQTSSTVPSKKRVTRNWIIYNKTASQAKQGGDNGHAGFLLGMGLFGHLSVLTITDICDYLTQGHEPTTIGILIGVAASKISTADALLSKTLCLHLPTLLPAQHWDIEISPLIQCSALVGLGFLYCRSGHRLIVQFLLEELSRKPTSDRCECREALALSAAWALAMVLLPKKLCSPPASTNISSERRQNYEDLSPSSNHSMQTSPAQHETDSPPSASFVTNTSTSRLAIPPSPFRPATKAAAAAVVGGGMTVEDLSAGNQNEVLKSLHDLKIEDCLHTFISGGSRPSDLSLFPGHHGSNGSHQQSYDVSAKSSRVLEGDHINRDVTSPGACIALGLIYISTNHSKILRFLELPQTVIELDSIRPDLLLYRCIGRCLIQWEYSIQPTKEWLDEQIPSAVQKVIASALEGTGGVMGSGATKPKLPKYVGPYGRARHSQSELSPSTAFSLYVNIITGYCLGIGVVFAGTFHPKAKELILSNLKWLQSLRENKGAKKLSFTLDKTHRNMIEMCISSVSLALSCVMAGSGDVDCLRILRELRWKVDDVIYGTHLALNMAIGLLFLGGGKYSLKRDPVSTACLLISILPRFPSRTIDHQYHLQALRHLYVLAVESRVLHTVDVDTGLPISVDLQLELISGEKTVIKVPGLLPQLNTVKSISVIESKQWEISDEVEGNDEKKHCNQYYPCRIDLASSSSALSHSVGGSAGRSSASTNQRILLPTFYVKKVPSAISVSANHSLTEMKEQSIIPPSSIRDRSSMIRALMSHQFPATENKESKNENSSPIAELVSSWIVQTPDLQDILFRSLQKEL